MNDIIKLGAILGIVTMIAVAALSVVNGVTKPRIEEQRRLALQQAVALALPNSEVSSITPVPDADAPLFFIGYDSNDNRKIAGYAFLASGTGYSSEIRTMIGVDTSWTILGMKVLGQAETPGLGTKVEEIRYGENNPWFTRQFIGKSGQNLAVDKDNGEIQSITGATISSRALTNSITAGIKQLKQNLLKYPLQIAAPDTHRTVM